MSTVTFSVRADERTQRELDELVQQADSRNDAVNQAIHLAYRQMRRDRMRTEALELANDPGDLADVRAVQEEFESAHAW